MKRIPNSIYPNDLVEEFINDYRRTIIDLPQESKIKVRAGLNYIASSISKIERVLSDKAIIKNNKG